MEISELNNVIRDVGDRVTLKHTEISKEISGRIDTLSIPLRGDGEERKKNGFEGFSENGSAERNVSFQLSRIGASKNGKVDET